jgi:hypothetical protein
MFVERALADCGGKRRVADVVRKGWDGREALIA